MFLNTASIITGMLAMSSTAASAPANMTNSASGFSDTTRLRLADTYVFEPLQWPIENELQN